MPRVGLEEVTSPASAQSVAKSAVFPRNAIGLVLSSNWAGFVAKTWQHRKQKYCKIITRLNETK